MGFCSSYSEVLRFEENAASSNAPDLLGCVTLHDTMLLFAADNVDHNIVSLDGKGTFHGMGMIAAITPGQQLSQTILRRKLSDLSIVEEAKVDVIEYRFAKSTRSVYFKAIPAMSYVDHNIDLLWEVSFRFTPPVPNWQGMMHTLCKQRDQAFTLYRVVATRLPLPYKELMTPRVISVKTPGVISVKTIKTLIMKMY